MRSSPRVAEDDVRALAAGHDVVARPAVQLVLAVLAVDVVVVAAAEQPVVAVAAEDRVDAVGADQPVVAERAADDARRDAAGVGLGRHLHDGLAVEEHVAGRRVGLDVDRVVARPAVDVSTLSSAARIESSPSPPSK